MTRILLAIPTYNCEKQIVRVIQKMTDHPNVFDQITQVLIVDNRSGDETVHFAAQEVKRNQLGHKISIGINRENYGLGGTHKVVFQWAMENHFDEVIILHGDDQADFQEVAHLTKVAGLGADAVLGSRFMKGSRRINYSKIRIAGNRFLNLVYSVLAGKLILDLGSGLNLFKLSAIDFSRLENFSDGFNFNMDLLLSFCDTKKNIVFVPISWREEDQVSNARNFKVGFLALRTLVKWRFHRPFPKTVVSKRSFTIKNT